MLRGTTGRPAVPYPITDAALPGPYPDPSVLRVGTDYYLATPTFEWYPAVRVHHSRDLVTWRSLGGILTDRRLLDLTGVADSGGVRSPCLSWADDLFHLAFTHLPGAGGGYRDPQNYVLTAPGITGPWSDPVPVHAHGPDPSLFHDDDGSTWLLTVRADWRPGRNRTAGIEIQRYERAGRTVGPARLILRATAGTTGGPRLYRRRDWHYLVTGGRLPDGTRRLDVARARDLLGPYRPDPAGPLLTGPAPRAGHGSLVATPDDRWYLAYPVGHVAPPPDPAVAALHPVAPDPAAILHPLRWTVDDWPRVDRRAPADAPPAPHRPVAPAARHPAV
ncbi:family 43 glycosylhydrolase, partial [Micromonospora echinofusca]